MANGDVHLKASVVDSFQGWAGEDTVCEDGVNFRGPRLEELVGGHDDGAAGVGHVVHQDRHSVLGARVRPQLIR